VVLSGTGADGTQGLLAFKAEGGITLAQEPKSAMFDNILQSAIASGAVDLILTTEQIAHELVRIARHPYIRPISRVNAESVFEETSFKTQDSLTRIFILLRSQCHVDFSHYKSNTVMRRIDRRMVLHQIKNLKILRTFLTQHPDAVKELYADILIHVTGFFRDADAFQALKEVVF